MSIITEIRKIPKGQWTKVTTVAEMVDATPAEISAAIIHLTRTEPDFEIMPESNRKTLTDMDRLYAVKWAGDDNHLIGWI